MEQAVNTIPAREIKRRATAAVDGLHPLSGKLAGCHFVSQPYSYPINLTLLITDKEIILLDFGGHDEVYH
jgi:hypothetical protein